MYVDITNTSPLCEIEEDNDLAFQGYHENQAYKGENEYHYL
ncbi:hypothetical protein Q4553_00855 [Tenacibaculum soleae]|nr:hypothetical protein [Tenacibaculum soleae]MDO6743112.1 hypothetical protein [Tenacibaculum soleae]